MTVDLRKHRSVDNLKNVSIKIRNYMCFGEAPQGFESIKPINIIIGRNNTGKSRLLDLIEYLVDSKKFKGHLFNGKQSEILLTLRLLESELRNVFQENTSGGEIGGNHWMFGKRFVDKAITIRLTGESERTFVSMDPPLGLERGNELESKLAKIVRNPFQNMKFRKILAERDIQSDASSAERDLLYNGNGSTCNVDLFINDSSYPRELVAETLLRDLNSIVEPDIHFEEITVRRVKPDGLWEIFLKESEKGYIQLSKSGSGLKTILLVLINILLIPIKENIPLENYIFAFEELENNLHPAIQRRLLSYIRKIALEDYATFFITTHSNVVIDLFSKDSNAQIYHVTHDKANTSAKLVTTYIDTSGILDDLDIRASDLLQSNGLIWVEGPSDRIYINRFIELWSDGAIKEGLNYQCIFYGGRIRAHLTANTDDGQQRKLFEILLANRHAIMLMDSDKKLGDDGIDDTKERIKDEFEKNARLCWTTEGRTIENYIPQSAMESLYDIKFSKPLGQYEDYKDYLKDSLPQDCKQFYKIKVLFAERILPYLKKEELKDIYDIDEKMSKMIAEIKTWNKIP